MRRTPVAGPAGILPDAGGHTLTGGWRIAGCGCPRIPPAGTRRRASPTPIGRSEFALRSGARPAPGRPVRSGDWRVADPAWTQPLARGLPCSALVRRVSAPRPEESAIRRRVARGVRLAQPRGAAAPALSARGNPPATPAPARSRGSDGAARRCRSGPCHWRWRAGGPGPSGQRRRRPGAHRGSPGRR